MKLYVLHDFYRHKFGSHVQYVLTFFAFFSRKIYFWYIYFVLQSQFDPLHLLFMGRFCLQIMDSFIISGIPQVISITDIIQNSLVMKL